MYIYLFNIYTYIKYTNLNIKDIDEIFSNYAERDQMFYKKFYEYRNIPFVEYAENDALRRQTEALANIVKKEMYDFTRKNVLGYTIRDLDGNVQFLGLKETYNRVLDEALVNVGTGKETFGLRLFKIRAKSSRFTEPICFLEIEYSSCK